MKSVKLWKARKYCCLFLMLSLFLVFVACGGQDPNNENANPIGDSGEGLTKISFILEWAPNTNHTGIYVAKENGYYEELGLDVEILTPPEDGAESQVASGKAQFGVSVQENLALFLTLENPLPIVAVASIIDHNTSGLISAKEKGIDGFDKLEGMTYASWDAPTELAILEQAVEDAGGDYSKLLTVPAPATDSVSLIQSGAADVTWVYEAWDVAAAKLVGLDYNFIKFSDESPVFDFYTPLIIANCDFLEDHPEIARNFLNATARGYEFAIENPEEAAAILVSAVPELSLDLVQASQEFLASEYRAEKPQWGTFDETRWKAFYDWMYEQNLIPTSLGNQGFTNEFLPDQTE